MELVIRVKNMEKRKILLREGHEIEVTLPKWMVDEERVTVKMLENEDNKLLGFALLTKYGTTSSWEKETYSVSRKMLEVLDLNNVKYKVKK